MYNSFAAWQEEVSHEIYVTEGFTLEECPAFHWWAYFNNGADPQEAVRQFFREDKYEEDDVSLLSPGSNEETI